MVISSPTGAQASAAAWTKAELTVVSSSRTDLARRPAHASRARVHAVHDQLAASSDVVDRVFQDLGGARRLDHDVEP